MHHTTNKRLSSYLIYVNYLFIMYIFINVVVSFKVTGKKGFVIKGNVNKTAFSDIFKENSIDNNTNVQKFLEQMVGDDKG